MSSDKTGHGPLRGLRVLEISSVVMAPMAGRILAKLGAEVTRVEAPLGDAIRRTGASRHTGMTGAALALNDGKKNITVDMKSSTGPTELQSLIKNSDVILTNHLPRRRQTFGLDWPTVSSLNPSVILCTAQGFSSHSDKANTPAYDDTVQAAAGVCDVYAKAYGSPRFAPYIMADKVSATAIVYSILAALYYREKTGEGQWIDVPMVDVIVDFNLIEQLNEATFEPPLGGAGWHRTLSPDRRPHQAIDGWVCIVTYTDQNWAEFLKLAGVIKSGAGQIPFATHQDRVSNSGAVQGIIADYAADRTLAQIEAECGRVGIPVQRVNTVESLVNDPYLKASGAIKLVDHPTEGKIWQTSPNIAFSRTPLGPTSFATNLDADRDEILSSVNGGEEQL